MKLLNAVGLRTDMWMGGLWGHCIRVIYQKRLHGLYGTV